MRGRNTQQTSVAQHPVSPTWCGVTRIYYNCNFIHLKTYCLCGRWIGVAYPTVTKEWGLGMNTTKQQQPNYVLPPLKGLHLAATSCDELQMSLLVQAPVNPAL